MVCAVYVGGDVSQTVFHLRLVQRWSGRVPSAPAYPAPRPCKAPRVIACHAHSELAGLFENAVGLSFMGHFGQTHSIMS
jgi:hypothetical protein